MSNNRKVIFITGVGRGIGRQTAILATQRGWNVSGFELDSSLLNSLALEISSLGGNFLPIQGNQADEEICKSAVKMTIEEFGKIDALVPCAVLVRQNQPFTEISKQIWIENIEINLNGIFYITQPIVGQMKKQGGGSIIFMSSVDAYTGNAEKPQYAMVKGALISLSKSIAKAYGSYGVRSNCVAPGMTRTPLTQERCDNKDIERGYIEATPLKRIGQPEDIAETIMFLASESSSWISGQTIHVNGGVYMH